MHTSHWVEVKHKSTTTVAKALATTNMPSKSQPEKQQCSSGRRTVAAVTSPTLTADAQGSGLVALRHAYQ